MRKTVLSYKISFITIIVLIYTIYILLDYHFFYMVDYWPIFKGNSLCFLISITGMLIWLIANIKRGKYIPQKIRWMNILCFAALIDWMMLCFFSIVKYSSQPASVTIVQHISLLYIIWTIPIYYCLQKGKGIKGLFSIINVICAIWYLLLIIQFFAWIGGKHLIFYENAIPTIKTRGHGIRLGLGSFGNIAILYNFDKIFKASYLKEKIKHMILVSIGLFCLVFVQQTRSLLAIVLLCVAFNLFLNSKKFSAKIGAAILVLVFISILTYSGAIGRFMFSFSDLSAESYGKKIRVEEIKYYLECFINNPIFGNGFTNYQFYPMVEYKQIVPYSFYYSDVGIFGLLAEIGMGTIFFYLIPVVRSIKIGKKAYKTNKNKYSFFITFSVYIILTSFTLIVTDTFRAISYPVYLAFALYVDHEINNMPVKKS